MKKKFVKVMLFGTLALTTITYVGCKDYDDDISNLQEQVNANKTTLEAIQATLASGQWVEKVDPIASGIRITLGNGKTFDITNGKDGVDGALYTIGDDGYWYKDDKKTDKLATPKVEIKGGYWVINGEQTTVKAEGTAGDDGLTPYVGNNGNWWIGEKDLGVKAAGGSAYVPNKDGYWYVDGKKTDLQWKTPGTITAAVVDGELILSGIEGYEEGFKLSMNTAVLRGLVFEPQGYINGVPAIIANALTYKPMDKSTDNIKNGATEVTTSTPLTATYYLNPSSITESGIDTKKLAFITKAGVPSYTRAIGDLKPNFGKIADGKLTVSISGNLAGIAVGQTVDLLALNVPVKDVQNDEEVSTVTSDFAALFKAEDLQQTNLDIANAKDATGTIHFDATFVAAKGQTASIELVHDQEINLKEYVVLHNINQGTHSKIEDIDKYGLEYRFDMDGLEYKVGTNQTDQQKFASVTSEGKLTAKVYDAEGTIAAIGRTPIIRVTLVDKNNNNAIVKIAYIKVQITADLTERIFRKGFDAYTLKGDCSSNEMSNIFGTEEMNTLVYNELGLTKPQFEDRYELQSNGTVNTYPWSVKDGALEEQPVGEVTEVADPNNPTTTNVLKWIVEDADIWANLGKTVGVKVSYEPKVGFEDLPVVSFVMYAKINTVAEATVSTNALYPNYWDEQMTYFKCNVKVPEVNESNLNTVFETSLWSGFDKTKIQVPNEYVGHIDYTFKFAVTQPKSPIAGVTLVANGDKLMAAGNIVAQITNDNKIQFVNTSATAKELLATKNFKVAVQLYGLVGTDEHEVVIGGKGNFNVLFIRPVNMTTTSPAKFKDGQSGGSTLTLKNIAELTDWRGQTFADNANFYGFYGVTSIDADLSSATCTLGANGSEVAIPGSLELTKAGTGYDRTITYKNNGSPIEKAFTIKVKVTVTYQWGSLSGNIVIPVDPTSIAN